MEDAELDTLLLFVFVFQVSFTLLNTSAFFRLIEHHSKLNSKCLLKFWFQSDSWILIVANRVQYGNTIQKFGVGIKINKCFSDNLMKEASSAHQGCIYLIQNTVKTVKFWDIITV